VSPQDPLKPRKRPVQRRSRETVDAIVEAAARVLAERGYAHATTNRIAETAGVSIGSLYEYFPNKDAILVAVAERHLAQMLDGVERALAVADGVVDSLDGLVRRLIEALLEIHERSSDLDRVLFSEAPHPPALHACVLQIEGRLAHAVEGLLQRVAELELRDADTAAHLVVQTAEALIHRFVQHGIHDLSRGDFVDEVAALLGGYLRGAGSTLGA